MPQPHLISTKVDHERSEEIYVKSIAWLPRGGRQVFRDEVWKQADRKLHRLGQNPEFADRTRTQAERVLRQLFERSGWKVSLEWQTASTAAP